MKQPKIPKPTKDYYFTVDPVYDHYKTVTVIDRCECCGHKIGSHTEKRGVKIVDYKINKHKKDFMYYVNQSIDDHIKDILFSPSITEKLLSKKEEES